MENLKIINGKRYKLVFAKFVRKNGKPVYPKNARVFSFWVEA